MKMNKLLAVLLTALFLTPFLTAFSAARAEDAPAFTADETAVLRGMDRSWLQGYTPSTAGDRWTMILPVRSEMAKGPVTAELALPAGRFSLFKNGRKTVTARMETKGVWGVRFAMDLFPDQKNGDYPCVIRLTGKDMDGKELAAEIPYVIRMRGAKEGVEKARAEITEVKAELSVGEEGTIQVTLANPCGATIMEDIEMKISDAAGHILPRGAETLRAGTLGIGESVTLTYPVTVTEKASVAPHVLKIDLGWTALGQAASHTANYTVAVRQEIRLEQGGLKMVPAVTAGDSVNLTLPLMNMGRADVVNVLATVSLPGITERQSVLVGNIQPGETKQAQIVLCPAKDIAGDFSGTLTVECTDQDGNPASFQLPVNLRVDAPKPAADKPAAAGSANAEKPGAVTWALAGGCALLLMLLATQSLVLRRKMHRLEEERL
jgi:hypothetical protein